MIPETRKGVSLNPAHMLPGLIIDQLIGPGVTIVASETPHLRYILQEQMAFSIATGQKFLGVFDVLESPVLFIQHGLADREAMRVRLLRGSGTPPLLDIQSEWPRIGEGAEARIDKKFLYGEGTGIVFLGDYMIAKGGFDNWYSKFVPSKEKVENPKDLLTFQYLNGQKAAEEIRSLRKIATKRAVSIVLGHDLTTQGKLRNRDFLHYHDTELHIRYIKRDRIYRLEVAPGSPYIPTNSWDLLLDEKNSRFLPRWIQENEAPKRKNEELTLLDNEKAILHALSEGEVMSLGELARKTGISRSTVHQRLKALQTEKKDTRVVSLEGDGKTLYLLNPSKERN